MDFVGDSLGNGRRMKCMTVGDNLGHEAVDVAVDFCVSGQIGIGLLDQAVRFRGYPAAVRTDNGPEFACLSFITGTFAHRIRHLLIQPGRPVQNGCIKCFIGRFRDERLKEHWFEKLRKARQAITVWRHAHSEVRPHGSIGRMLPSQTCSTTLSPSTTRRTGTSRSDTSAR